MAKLHVSVEIETNDFESLKAALGIPEYEVYVELAPSVDVHLGEVKQRRDVNTPQYLVEFIIAVTGQLTAESIRGAIRSAISHIKEKSRQAGAASITVVERVKLPITSDDESKAADAEIENLHIEIDQGDQ